MKTRKFRKIFMLLGTLIMSCAILLGSTGNVNADTGNRYFGIKFQRDSGFTYKALEKKIFKIVEYTSEAGTTEKTGNNAIYCIKGGAGFGSADIATGGSPKIRNYTQYFNLKEPENIDATYKTSLPQDTANYNSLVWILDHIYIPNLEGSSKTQLLDNAAIPEGSLLRTDNEAIDEIIDVVQQLAIWHFTNPDAADSYHADFLSIWRNQVVNVDDNYRALGDIYADDGYIEDDISTLFNYFIGKDETAKREHAEYNYKSTAITNPITVNKSGIESIIDGANYKIGPFSITENSGAANYDLSIQFRNGSTVLTPTILNEDGTTAVSGTLDSTAAKTLVGKRFYITIPVASGVSNVTMFVTASTSTTTQNYWAVQNNPASDQPIVVVEKQTKDFPDSVTVSLEDPDFDLALRKFITKIGTTDITDREPEISTSELQRLQRDDTQTANKVHKKDPLTVKTGDHVVYTIRIYNEGNVDGYAKQITDHLPTGLSFDKDSDINKTYKWSVSEDGKTVTTDYLKDTKLNAFNKATLTLDKQDIKIECIVEAETKQDSQTLKNIAEITSQIDINGNEHDRDSVQNSLTDSQLNDYGTVSKQDDDDFEDLILPGRYFDLALRKFITNINGVDQKDSSGKFTRQPVVDITPLINGSGDTTATYNHPKKPLSVAAGNTVIYTIRVYNEGQIDGYVQEITDHLPPELEFINDEFNAANGWKLDPTDATNRTIKTTILSKESDEDNLIKAFDGEDLDYKDVQVKCLVKQDAPASKQITNIAEITAYIDAEGTNMTDRDNKKVATIPADEDLPAYKADEINKGESYIEGQEDDDDFEKVILERFDLALRKFITGVNDTEITDRVPQVDKSKFNTEDENGKVITDLTYNHTKEPLPVEQNDIVIYTIRVYNEGTQAGYASEIKDDLPEGLEFLPDNEINKKYRWILYDKDGNQTDDISKAVSIRTDYLSIEQEQTAGENLMKAFDPATMEVPDFKDVKVAFKVQEPNTSDRILINKAEISEDTDEGGNPVNDIDSTPDKWIDEEDDQDIEKVKVKYFDLSLRKWVSQVIIIENGKETVRDTGHYAEQDPEPIVKVDLNRHKLNNVIVKFKYQIRIKNEGEIAGYAKEISDYIPEGLKFNAADNAKWTQVDGKVTTDQLKDILLKPGETATVEIILTWENDQNNLGVKINTAEISKDYNDSNTPDIDSTPNNKKQGEDDIDDAPVALSILTGSAPKYIAISTSVFAIIGIGVILIKKYVL